MDKYTKVSDKLVAKYGIKVAFVYAKLSYRMKLSVKSNNYYDNGYYIIYKIKDLQHDCHLGRNSIINILSKLEHANLICRVHTMYANKIYLPEFDKHNINSEKGNSESPESKLSEQQKHNNKLNNNYVYSSHCSSVKKATQNPKKQFPKIDEIIKRFGKPLVNYALQIYHNAIEWGTHVHNSIHFIYGILRRWQRKGIKTVNDAMLSEHDRHAKLNDNGPIIPIFKI